MSARKAGAWLGLLAASAAGAAILEWIGLSAGLLLGPMLAAIAFSARGAGLSLSRPLFIGAQAVIGCLIAGTLDIATFSRVVTQWPIFLGVTAATLGASSLLGYLLSRWRVLPGSTAIWGSMPGAASAMVVIADAFGADARLVAFMTYTRVVCVAAAASILAAVLGAHRGDALVTMLAPAPLIPSLATLAVAGVGALIGLKLRIPGGALLAPMAVGIALHALGIVRMTLPEPVLAISYALIGWRIGLAFTRETLALARKALPRVLLATFALIGFSAALSLLLSRITGIDPVSAYLAVSPGGLDSVAIIATSVPVDQPFVMAMQALRFLAVLALGPTLARFAARRFNKNPPPEGEGDQPQAGGGG
ncbi:AbrB family transcriptional regulator [Sphingomonas sp. HITSZ_GF]|uniref:AbrB family transcriptional regulator n=1 Tax=Sphingomonas sp. HITSZ_GF TaxID=3037247 RepID=UPI00240DF42E|nr:AbrB family transcriptional regulator [Sphingomonas sp. HITSZ_GF]MDG2534439.1 AbrB family transcriptional regulator [Sphingomonas sp. HITSZ_GF]